MGTHFYDLNNISEAVVEPEYDSEGYLQTNKKVVDHLLRHLVPVETGRLELDSAVYDYESKTLTSADIEECYRKFNRNYGQFVDGKKLRVTSNTNYFKFNTNVTISYDAGIKRLTKDQKLFSLLSLYQHSINQLPTLSVFVNGLKIPDKNIMIYMTESSTDILIPEKYVTKNVNGKYNEMEIYVQKHIYKVHHYFSDIVPDYTKGYTIDLNDPKKNYHISVEYNTDSDGNILSSVKSCNNIMLYCNGKLCSRDTYYFIKDNDLNTITIMFGSTFATGDEIEIVIDSDIRAVNDVVLSGNYGVGDPAIRCMFYMPESATNYKFNSLYGPLPKDNCYFFINNKRIPNDKVKQVGRMNFSHDYNGAGPYTCTMYYTDKGKLDESKRYVYGDDYYLENIFGVKNTSWIIKDAMNGKIFSELNEDYINKYICSNPKHRLDFVDIFNRNGKLYDFNYMKSLNNIPKQYDDYDEQVKRLIKEGGNHVIRDFLNMYTKNDIYDEVYISDKETCPEFYSYTFDTDKTKINSTYSFFYLIDINGRHIPSTEFEIVDNKQYNHVKLPKELFKEGYNRVHLREVKYDTGSSDAIEFKHFRTDVIQEREVISDITDEEIDNEIESLIRQIKETNNNENLTDEEKKTLIDEYTARIDTLENAKISNYKYYFTFDNFKTVMFIKDLLVLVPSYNNDRIYYARGKDAGWVIMKNYVFVDNHDGTMTLLMREKPEEEFCIYSKRFSFKYTMTIDHAVETLDDMSIPIGGNDSFGLPVIPSGTFTIFLNGDKLYSGIDFVFRHPGNYNMIAYTSLCLKRKVHPGDVLDIYFEDIKNITVGHSDNILSHAGTVWNKYGLIYFGDMKMPYSTKYIDLYINNKYIYPDQIDILSDKLIRVDPEILNPMFDIFAETCFSVDTEILNRYFTYENTPFEDLISELFTIYDFSNLTDPKENNGADEVYESFDENVDSWGRIPNNRRDEDSETALEKAEEETPKRYNLYENAYLLWLHSNSVKTIMKPGENINQDIMRFFKFYIEEDSLSERQDISVSARNTKVFNDIEFGMKKYPIEYAERVRMFLKFAKANSLNTNLLLEEEYTKEDGITDIKLVPDMENAGNQNIHEKLRNHYPISNAMYPRDFPSVISSRTKIAQMNKDIVVGGPASPIYNDTTKNK